MLERSFRWSSLVGFPTRQWRHLYLPAMTTDRTEGWVPAQCLFALSHPCPQPEPQMPQKESETGAETNLTQPLRKCLKQCNYIIISKKNILKNPKEQQGEEEEKEQMGPGHKKPQNKWRVPGWKQEAGTSQRSQELGCQPNQGGRIELWVTDHLRLPPPPPLICWLGWDGRDFLGCWLTHCLLDRQLTGCSVALRLNSQPGDGGARL